MKLVAVIDLLDGEVVHARRGDRRRYAPIVSGLCSGSDPVEIARALLDLGDFHALYLADLNAIQGNGDNALAIARIAAVVRDIRLWVDAGVRSIRICDGIAANPGIAAVIGSETLGSADELAQLQRAGHDVILSLDFRGEQLLGPREVMERADLWPDRVLAMNLFRVGSAMGPDLSLIRMLHETAPTKSVFASGGVRNADDLRAAECAGASGALLATSLHDGSLTGFLASRRTASATN